MVRINRSYRIQVCSTKMCPNGELPSDSQQTDRHQPDTEVREKPVSQFIIAPRAQASRRCETEAPLDGKPPSFATVSVLDPFRALREPDRRRRKRRTAFRLRTKNGNKPKYDLTEKAPYRFESGSLLRRVNKLSVPLKMTLVDGASDGAAHIGVTTPDREPH